MAMSSGYRRIFAIIIAACYLQGTRCMNRYSLLPKSSENLEETIHLSAGPGGSYNDFEKTSKEKGVYDDRAVQPRTQISQGDIDQYLSSVGPISTPTPGSASQQLDLIIQKAKTGLADRDYWPAVHMKSLAEDFELTSQELNRLGASIKKMKTYSRAYPHTIKTKLTESVGDLREIHKSLKQYISYDLRTWADRNHLPSPTIFEDHVRPQEKKNASGSQETRLTISAANVKENLPHECLDNLAASMRDTFNIRDNREDPDFWAIHRIYIKTVDQIYKHGLITQKRFEQLIQKDKYADEYVRAAARNLFWHFSHIEKEYQNPLYRNSDILVGLPYSLPFTNMLNVLSPQNKEMFFHEIIKLDALDWIAKTIKARGEEGLTPGETTLARSFKALFETDLLVRVFSERYLDQEKVVRPLGAIFKIFTDTEVWNEHWGRSESIRIMGQILKFIDQTFLQTESRKEENIVVSVRGKYTDFVKNKLDLLSSRAQAIVELENISKYLGGKFPLRNDLNIKKPIPPAVELSLIEELIANSPSLKAYRSNLEIQDDGLTEIYNQEIDSKIKELETKIKQLKGKHSGSNSKSGTLRMIKDIFKGKGKASANSS
ncbi:hypothetical protein PGTUg99_008796 [Puccinia graminis f. sp. tritici]|uniref:Uncharacterized protein n=1 Tax=Puccinia graminis f. sp. tritici TaxID=56615 RepID=A0A5B0RVG1_PUCGR|nr:hypothetical protein PGTUg99_008796 [Puccinia graminis f. sp. tritici]